jgi:hypothetical protein
MKRTNPTEAQFITPTKCVQNKIVVEKYPGRFVIVDFTENDKKMILSRYKMDSSEDEFDSGDLDKLFEEYRKFMEILVNFEDISRFCPSPLVDDMWRAHIICTKSYLGFCRNFNDEFIHHIPSDGFKSYKAQNIKTL